jgi:hypothetical protein
LDVGRMNDSVEQETYCVDKNVPLLALDLLARIVAVRINARPPYMGRLKSSADSCLRRFNFALNPAGLILRSQHVPAQSIGSILWFDPRREHSSVPTAKSLGRRAQGLSRLAASFAATRRAWP